jgi:hypothetical protein
MKLKQSERTLTTLGNAANIVSLIAQEVMGEDVADTLEGAPLTRRAIHDMALAEIAAQPHIATHLGA